MLKSTSSLLLILALASLIASTPVQIVTEDPRATLHPTPVTTIAVQTHTPIPYQTHVPIVKSRNAIDFVSSKLKELFSHKKEHAEEERTDNHAPIVEEHNAIDTVSMTLKELFSHEKEHAEKEHTEQQYAEQHYADKQHTEKQYAEKEYAEEQYAEKEYAEEQYAEKDVPTVSSTLKELFTHKKAHAKKKHPIIHRISNDEDLWQIAEEHGVPYEDVLKYNEKLDPYDVSNGYIVCLKPDVLIDRPDFHRVVQGDNSWTISTLYSMYEDELQEFNPDLDINRIYPNNRLCLKKGVEIEKPHIHTVKPTDENSWDIATSHNMVPSQLQKLNPGFDLNDIREGNRIIMKPNVEIYKPHTHKVSKGEKFDQIAAHYNMTPEQLHKLNPKINPRKLKAGNRLVLKPGMKVKRPHVRIVGNTEGETAKGIAASYNMDYDKVKALNEDTDLKHLKPGSLLRLKHYKTKSNKHE